MEKSSKNNSKISSIIFDWGGIFSHSGDPLSHPEVIQRLKKDRNSISLGLVKAVESFSRGQMTSREYWRIYAKVLNIPEYSPRKLKNLYLEYNPRHNMLDILKSLSLKYPITLLSNLNIDMKTAIIKGLDINKYFKHMIFSSDVGLLKPELAIYHLALNALGLPASETLFVDDELKNIESASKLGIQTILFKSEQQFRKELDELKLL